jgi:hypothetical protein
VSDDALSILAVWMSQPVVGKEEVRSAIDAVLDRDRDARARDRRMRLGGLFALALLLPALVWSAAYGVTALVRVAYGLMAIGCAMSAAAELLYLEWSRQSLPGPVDNRSQLQRTVFLLERQIAVVRMAPLWSSPVFIGVALIGVWLSQNRTSSAAFIIWTFTVVGWLALGAFVMTACRRLHERRQHVEQLLRELL